LLNGFVAKLETNEVTGFKLKDAHGSTRHSGEAGSLLSIGSNATFVIGLVYSDEAVLT